MERKGVVVEDDADDPPLGVDGIALLLVCLAYILAFWAVVLWAVSR